MRPIPQLEMRNFALVFLVFTGLGLFAQTSTNSNESSAWLIMPSFGVQYAGGDMELRFGQNYSAGLGVGYKTADNWTFSLQAQFMFGTEVKNGAQLLNPALSPDGYIFNQTGNYATFALDQRGAYGTFDISKTIPGFLAANNNSGFNILLGAGYLAHWIKINNVGDDSPQIIGDYAKGYDELSGGFLLKQSIGYQYLSTNRRINLRLSCEIMEAFTTNYRKFSYSTGKPVSGKMNDLVYGFRLEWFLPIYNEAADTYFYD